MLILSRRSRQSVVVGGGGSFHSVLKVTVLDVTGGRVKLGFEGSAEIPVHRLEVWERIAVNAAPPPAGPAPERPGSGSTAGK